ncbi:YqcC family protein [Pseudomonas matsuisoli]|uniref:YqcC-like domain-containing protein n=1 Tax=Pseudomonas matsuisoli TaxID=1515666 RepID=A0A917UZF7_9PSED|nr:YqcC family protein [Pseudomonas matsuisoli]GGJ99701.1 hypothetical protein GCM10009304_26870 [Pseudomonas matsuisoli]
MTDSRLPLLADQLLLVERELRRLGWWEDIPPPDKALTSEQPFCVDTLDFSQWLQWIFLPRMKLMIEQDAELPTTSGIRSMAEYVYQARLADARPLIEALGRFDALITG